MTDPRLPTTATVGGGQRNAIGTDDKAILCIAKTHAQHGFVRPFGDQPLSIAHLYRIRPSRTAARIVEDDLGDLIAVQLQLPVITTIAAVQDHTTVPYRPTIGGGSEVDI